MSGGESDGSRLGARARALPAAAGAAAAPGHSAPALRVSAVHTCMQRPLQPLQRAASPASRLVAVAARSASAGLLPACRVAPTAPGCLPAARGAVWRPGLPSRLREPCYRCGCSRRIPADLPTAESTSADAAGGTSACPAFGTAQCRRCRSSVAPLAGAPRRGGGAASPPPLSVAGAAMHRAFCMVQQGKQAAGLARQHDATGCHIRRAHAEANKGTELTSLHAQSIRQHECKKWDCNSDRKYTPIT